MPRIDWKPIVPAEFHGAACACPVRSKETSFLDYLSKHWKEATRFFGSPLGSTIPLTGQHNIFGWDVFFSDRDPQIIWLHFRSREDLIGLWNHLHRLSNPPEKSQEYPLIKWGGYSWQKGGAYDPRPRTEYVGGDSYICTVLQDIQILSEHNDYLKSIGESSHSLNYLLHGPPGVGKTSLVIWGPDNLRG